MATRTRLSPRTMGNVAPVTPDQLRTLARLKTSGILELVYLAGGVAVAVHLGHRRSNDLDLFSRRPDMDLESMRARMVQTLDATVVSRSDAALSLQVDRTAIDVVRYPYPHLRRPARGPSGVLVASLRDLAAMKLAAITRRGLRRDFWDVHEIVVRGGISLAAILDDYQRKFAVAEVDLYSVVRALTWFDDAERDRVLPDGMRPKQWRDIRAWFEANVALELRRRTAAPPRTSKRGARSPR